MASIDEGKIEQDTIALYNNLREIRRFSASCHHWRGQDWPTFEPEWFFEFPTEGAALKWFRTGQIPPGTRPMTHDEAAAGCACQAAAGALVVAPPHSLVVV